MDGQCAGLRRNFLAVSRLEELPNLGAVMVQKLKEAGIETPEQLGAMGAKQAWR